MVTIVRPSWIDKVHEQKALVPEQPYSPNPRNIFRDLFVTCSGICPGDKANLYGGIKALGGQFSDTLTVYTSHVIATSDEGPKCEVAKRHGKKIVLPHWIDHCLKLARRLDETPYLFPNPPLLENSEEKINEDFINTQDLAYSHSMSKEPHELIKGSLFKDKQFFICDDLNLTFEETKNTIPAVIRNQQGEVTENLEDADVYIGKYRDGDLYKRACNRQIDVGSIAWVYWMVAHGKWTSPTQLLHYPVSRDPIPGFDKYTIAITNFIGEARAYIESLIIASGAQYTKSLKMGENTHVIAAMPQGAKYEAARKWNMHVVNSLWLEESYALWQIQSETNRRYTTLPDRIDLTEVLNKTVLNTNVLSQFYCDSGEELTSSSSRKRRSASELGPALLASSPLANVNASSPRHASSRSAKSKATESLKEQGELEYQYLQKFNKSKPTKRHELPALEDEEPVAKRKKSNVINGRKTETITSEINSANGNSSTKKVDEDTESNSATKSSSKSKPKAKNNADIYFVTTGLDDYVSTTFNKKKAELEELGIHPVKDVQAATHLVASNIKRTANFLNSMAVVKDVVLPDYLMDCLEQREKIELTDEYLLKSTSSDLAHALKSKKRGKIFAGVVFNFTAETALSPFFDIVRAHGGEANLVRSQKPKGTRMGQKQLSADIYRKSKNGMTILITAAAKSQKVNNPQIKQFRSAVPDGLVFVKDFIVESILSSNCDLDSSVYRI